MKGAVWGTRCAVILGMIFVYAAWGKITDPAAFAEAIYRYDVLPDPAANLVAVTLPWVELAAGFCLIVGFWQRPAALLVAGLLVFFIALLALTWGRGISLDCGCIPGADPRNPPQAILEDLVMLLMAVPAFVWGDVRWWTRGEEQG